MTLYSLSAERGEVICTSASCTAVWHPLSASAHADRSRVVSTVTRPDGSRQ